MIRKSRLGGRESTALSYARRSIEALKKATEDKKNNEATINLAWFRLVCPVAELRDAGEALRLARELTARSPERADSWTILGAALYHGGDFQAALSAFQKARELDAAKFGFWDFYVAMAHWRLDHKQEAQACFDRAAAWMKGHPTTKLQHGIHSQAASVLKLPDPGPPSRTGQAAQAK